LPLITSLTPHLKWNHAGTFSTFYYAL
jgi:hypothetical protein